MVTRVDKFLGGLGKDVTNIANVHATENRITFGGLENPSANAHVVGTVLASTNAIVGAEIVTSGHTLDVRGTANVGALTATSAALTGDILITSTNSGSSLGPTLEVFRDSASPISTDYLGAIDFTGNDLGDNKTTYGRIYSRISLPTEGSEAATISIQHAVGSTLNTALTVASTYFKIGGNRPIRWEDIGGTVYNLDIKPPSTNSGSNKTIIFPDATGTVLTTGNYEEDIDYLGLFGNNSAYPNALSIGTPANVTLRHHTASGAANLIIGDATSTSPYNLDVRGTANTGALTVTGITTSSATADRAAAIAGDKSIASSVTTSTELGYLSGVTSAVQTQLAAHTTEDTAIETRRTNNIAGAISSVLTSDLTASRVMVTDGSGKISVDTGVTATELGYLDATSSIQTQLDAAGGGGSAGTGSLKGNDPTSTDYLGANHDCGAALVATEDVFTEAIAARTDLDLLKQPLYSLGTIDNGSVA